MYTYVHTYVGLLNSWQYSGWIRLRHTLSLALSLKINKCYRWCLKIAVQCLLLIYSRAVKLANKL